MDILYTLKPIFFFFFYFIFLLYDLALGITYGYPDIFFHKTFKATAWQEVVMLYCGLLCGLRSPLGWVGVHLCIHEFADTEKDPIVQSLPGTKYF